jgi:shikimate dehydrogenase
MSSTIHYDLASDRDQYAVMGHPISHSLSPAIHQAFAEQTKQKLHYQAIDVPEDQFVEAVNAFREAGGKGLNVTVPFKEQAWELCDHRSEAAQLAGAVNTLQFREDGIYGDNTDGTGLIRDISVNHATSIEGKRVLILGAGGAVRGVIQPLLRERPAECVIANRTFARAEALVEIFADLGNVTAAEFDALVGQSFDLIINGTSASLSGALPQLPSGILTDGAMSYDMMYANQPTPFVRWGLLQRAKISVDGFGMLVEQAAEAFYLWRGVRPLTNSVITEIKP